jgi:hypothetical protein
MFAFAIANSAPFYKGSLTVGELRASCGAGMSKRHKRRHECPTIQFFSPLLLPLQDAIRSILITAHHAFSFLTSDALEDPFSASVSSLF